MMTKSGENSAVLIAGPTASGKSALAMQMAAECDGVVINADSMQVYRELLILSARPSADDEGKVPHRLYGHVSAVEDYSAGRWLVDATSEIRACWSIGKTPIIVGGTGLYFMALLGGLADVPAVPEEVRQKWRNFEGDLHAELAKRDMPSASKINAADRQRLIRALEVVDGTGKSLRDWQDESRKDAILNEINIMRFFVDVPREQLYARAEVRFDKMLALGALDEVRAMPNLDPMKPAMKAIGVPELLAHLRGDLSLEDAVTQAKTATRQYIKRQLTWWRGHMNDWSPVST